MIKNKLEQWRKNRGKYGITKAHLANQIRVNRSCITKIENRQAQPSAEMMFRIAAYFGCQVEDIFHYVPEGGK